MIAVQERATLHVGLHCPYGLEANSPNGVTAYSTEIDPRLRRKGFDVTLIGPHIKNNLADETIGRPVSIPINKTNIRTSFSLNSPLAHAIHRRHSLDVLFLQEPLVAPYTTAVLIGGGKTANIGVFHANAEKLSWGQKGWIAAGRLLPYARQNRFGVPTRVSSNTIGFIRDRIHKKIAVSEVSANYAKAILETEEDIEIHPNGIDTDFFTPDGERFPWSNDTANLLFVGRWDERKGIPDLLAAFVEVRKEIPNAHLYLAGDGKMREVVLQKIIQYGLEPFITLLGVLSTDDLAKAYRSTDILVAPSIGGEGWGRVPAEGLSSGTLVVATDVYAIDQQFATVVRPRDWQDLAVGIIKTIQLSIEKKEERRHQGRHFIKDNYDWEIVTNQIVVVVENAFRTFYDETHKELTINGASGVMEV